MEACPCIGKRGRACVVEKSLGSKLPQQLKAFLTTYHHCFEPPIGENPTFDHFAAVKESWNPVLVRCGYLPFTWDEEGAYIRCIDLKNMPDEDKCGVFEIDHEILFSLDEDSAERSEVEAEMNPVAENFIAYLEALQSDEI